MKLDHYTAIKSHEENLIAYNVANFCMLGASTKLCE